VKREDSKKKHESLLEESPRLTVAYVFAFLMQPQVRPALCLLLTATVLIITAAISAYVLHTFEKLFYKEGKLQFDGPSRWYHMLQVVEIGSQLTVFFGSILLIIAAVILAVVVVRFNKERSDYNGDGKTKKKGKDFGTMSDIGNSDAGNSDAGNSGAGGGTRVSRMSKNQLREKTLEYYRNNPMGPAKRQCGMTKFDTKCSEYSVEKAKLTFVRQNSIGYGFQPLSVNRQPSIVAHTLSNCSSVFDEPLQPLIEPRQQFSTAILGLEIVPECIESCHSSCSPSSVSSCCPSNALSNCPSTCPSSCVTEVTCPESSTPSVAAVSIDWIEENNVKSEKLISNIKFGIPNSAGGATNISSNGKNLIQETRVYIDT